MAITRPEVEHVARLARLGLNETELTAFTSQLDRILAHVDALKKVDTADVPPTFHVLPLQNVFRSDDVQDSLPQSVSLGNAPAQEDGTFKVPKITEG